jgi:hypothetical protein
VVNAILDRKRAGRNFSLMAVAEMRAHKSWWILWKRAARLKAQREADTIRG